NKNNRNNPFLYSLASTDSTKPSEDSTKPPDKAKDPTRSTGSHIYGGTKWTSEENDRVKPQETTSSTGSQAPLTTPTGSQDSAGREQDRDPVSAEPDPNDEDQSPSVAMQVEEPGDSGWEDTYD